jgi:DNA-binding transcriptional LysR family regulator
MPNRDLSDLEAFVAVARARNFRAAARLGAISPSALSEAIRRLEKRLKVRLLNRTTRSVTPTEAGLRLLERLGPALTEITDALDAINDLRDSPVGSLRLTVPTVVAATFLPAIVARFLAAYPGVTLEVIGDDSYVDVVAGGFDAGIRYEERVERDMIAVPIGPRVQRFATAASPDLLAKQGTPRHPRDLMRFPCIRHRFASGALAGWEFAKGEKIVRINPSGPLIATTSQIEVASAAAGLGVVTTFEDILRPALDRGAIVPVLRDWWQDFSGPLLYYPSRAHVPAPLRAFVDFVKRENAAERSAASPAAPRTGRPRRPSSASS